MSSEKFRHSIEGFAPNAQGDLTFLGHTDKGEPCGDMTCAFMDVSDMCPQAHCNMHCAPQLFYTKASNQTVAATWTSVAVRLPINSAEEMAGKHYTAVSVIATYSDGSVHPATFRAGCTINFWTVWEHNIAVCHNVVVVGWMPMPPAMSRAIPVRVEV